ncbi:fibronectin type III domain-containing protein [Chryseobacterium defluvii]|uniref:Putative secreted protein (Por secretion system target) n=1 Tax=Chryseobacterium defluvii TaxID=160396 RepID=A0A495SC08_9FLAO|nr:fibronectin type III domain-containing protein [Chryseobacterium defluvii]RKS96824.1 putative secreted protein (Por secretion system target) [Chryseobacterium defluvii]
MKHFYNLSKCIKNKSYLKKAILGLAFLFGTHQSADAQVNAYSFAQSTGSYAPASGTAAVLGTATDNTTSTNLNSNVYPVTLPFNFVFNGTSYSSLNVSSNGFVTFGTTAPSTTTTSPISSTTTYEGAISIFGRDISSFFNVNGISGSIVWETIGTAPNREIVIEWKNFRPNNATAVTTVYSFSFQIRLQETSNVIKMVYDAGTYLAGSTAISGTLQVGLRGATTADFNNRLNASTLEFINSTPGTTSSSTQNMNTVNAIPGMPTAGLTYTWTPPNCWTPSGVNITNITTNSATVNWIAPSIAPGSYEVYYSTSNTAPTASTPPTVQNITGLSTPIDPLQPLTTYYVWVRSSCGTSEKSTWTNVTNFTTHPTCWTPSGVNITNITTNSATVNWTAPSVTPASYEVYYSTSNTAPTASTTPTVQNIPGLSSPIGPLQSSTPYYVWVRSSCGTSDKSTWTSVASFTTQCDAITGAYFEGFEGYPAVSNGSTGGVLPICWTNLGTANGGHISNSTSSTITGTNTLYLWTSGARIAYVALPPMNTLQSGNYRLKFDAKASVTAGGILQIGYLDTTNTFVELTTFSVATTATVYPFSFDIPVLPAGVTQLAIKNPGTPANSLSIDNVSYELKNLATSEIAEKNKLKIYPNPFSDVINISDVEKVKSIAVLEASGRVLKVIGQASSSINLSDLKQGVYILNVTYKDNTISSHKIIKK